MSKKTKQRDCPALGRTISSLECATGRHGSVACSADCPHNPFGPHAYDELLALDERLNKRSLTALEAVIGKEALGHLIRPALDGDEQGESAANANLIRALHFERDAEGRSFSERWLASGQPALTRDERTLLAGKSRNRAALVEILEIRADGMLRVTDLLAPELGEFLLLDRTRWACALRYEIFLCWMCPLPHFHKLSRGGLLWPEWQGLDLGPLECLAEIVAHAGGPAADAPAATRRDWLALHFNETLRRVHAVSDYRRAAMLAGLDIAWGWAEFELPAPASATVEQKLGSSPDLFPGQLEPDETQAGFTTTWDWCDAPGEADDTLGRLLLGRVLRRGDTWRIVASNRARLARLREAFLNLAGSPGLAPTREYLQDIAKQEAARQPKPGDALVPPRLAASPATFEMSTRRLPPAKGKPVSEKVARFLEDANTRWPDTPIPALQGRTPREAVGDPAGRAVVIRLLKPRVTAADRKQLLGHPEPGPESIIRELGLAELELPPLPPRPCPPELAEEAKRLAARSRVLGFGPITKTLSIPEADELVDTIFDFYAHDEDLILAWHRACPGLDGLVDDLSEADLEAEEILGIHFAMALAWAIVVGNCTQPLRLDLKRIELTYRSGWKQLASFTRQQEQSTFAVACPDQPNIALVVFSRLLIRERELRQLQDQPRYTQDVLAWLHACLPAYTSAAARASA